MVDRVRSSGQEAATGVIRLPLGAEVRAKGGGRSAWCVPLAVPLDCTRLWGVRVPPPYHPPPNPVSGVSQAGTGACSAPGLLGGRRGGAHGAPVPRRG